MGRVRKYKKIKACDPFSKRVKVDVDTIHDEPPELFQERVKRERHRRKDMDWDNPDDREHLIQQEGLRILRQRQAESSLTSMQAKTIEPKREDESMKAFKQRIRQVTRLTLRDELKKMSATAQKRKLKLKERSAKRKSKKLSKKGDIDYNHEEVVDFSFNSSDTGKVRPSDMGISSSFVSAREAGAQVRFGERVERPPDLASLAAGLSRGKRKAKETRADEEENEATVVSRRVSVSSLCTADDSSISEPHVSGRGGVGLGSGIKGIIYAGVGGAKANAAEMEQLRLKVQAAYRELKAKRAMNKSR